MCRLFGVTKTSEVPRERRKRLPKPTATIIGVEHSKTFDHRGLSPKYRATLKYMYISRAVSSGRQKLSLFVFESGQRKLPRPRLEEEARTLSTDNIPVN